jgi:hypothetical protein
MSIEAMKMALEALEMTQVVFEAEGKDYGLSRVSSAINTLRQAIEQAEKQDMTVSECTCKAADMPFGRCCKAVEQEPFILDRGCYERGCIAYDERDGDGVNISKERVDEMAKREHEPWPSVKCTCGGTIYFKHTKREWVGLTDEEARKFYEKYTNREELIYAIDKFLEEKNT